MKHRRNTFRWLNNPISQFGNETDAIVWAVSSGAFNSQAEAQTAYDGLRVLYSGEQYKRWIEVVNKRRTSVQHRESLKNWEKVGS